MTTEHPALPHRQARALRRIERALAHDRALVHVAGLFPQPIAHPQPLPADRGSRQTHRPTLRPMLLVIVLAVLGLASGVTGALAGITWLTAASFIIVSAAGAVMVWRGARAVQSVATGAHES